MKPKHLLSIVLFVFALVLNVVSLQPLFVHATISGTPVLRSNSNTPSQSAIAKTTTSPKVIGTLYKATWCADPYIDDLSGIYPPYYNSQPIYDSSGLQLFTFNSCPGRPYIVYPDYFELTSTNSVGIYCNNVLAARFTGPGKYTANSATAAACGGQNWWGDLVGISVTPQKPPAPVLSATMASPTAINFSWTESDPTVKYYVLYTQLGDSGYVLANNITGTSYTDNIVNVLPPGQTYGPFYVVAFKDSATYSDRSNTASPTATGNAVLSLTSASPIMGTASFSVSAGVPDVNVQSMSLYVNGNRIGTRSGTPWNFTFDSTGIPNGTYQAFAVVYYNTSGISGVSNTDPGQANGSSRSNELTVVVNNSASTAAGSKINPPNGSNTVAANAGSSVTLTGSFPTTNAAVQLSRSSQVVAESSKSALSKLFSWLLPSAFAQDFVTLTDGLYEIDNVTSNGTSLSFIIPSTLPSGSYTLKVGTPSNFWSNPISLNVSGGSSASPTNAIPTYTCPSGYTLDSSRTVCNKPAVVQQGSTSFAANANYSCPSGYTRNASTCQNASSVIPANVSYSCSQQGISPTYTGGTYQCVIPSGYVWSPASTATPKLTYSCPSGYLMDASGNTCHQDFSPRNLYATASAGIINLTWQAYPYKQVSSYSVERAPGGTTKFAQIIVASPFTKGGSSQYGAYDDASVSIGQKYSYRVRSQFPDGTYSDYSGTTDVTATKISTPKVSASVSSASELKVSWSDSDSGITGFSLTDSAGTTSLFARSLGNTVMSGLLPKTKYCYTIIASFRADNSIQSPASSQGCATTQTPKMSLATPTSLQLSSGSGLSVTNSNNAARITSVDLYVGKSSTPFSTSKTIYSIPFSSSGLANGKYKVYAVVHFDSGAKFKTKSITIQVKNTVNQTSLNKTIIPDGDSADTDAIFTSPDGSTEDVSVTSGDTGTNSADSPVTVSAPTQTTSVTTTPTTPVVTPTSPPSVSLISGATQLNIGDSAKWIFTASDPQGSAMTFSINWGDGSGESNSSVPSFKHSYTAPGTYTIIASAKDALGLMGQNSLSVSVANPSSASQTTATSNPAGATAPSTPASVTASVLDASSDKVGVWNVWGPGAGRANGNNPYDWHFGVTLSNASGKTLSYATIIMNGIREGWSSSASTNNAFGVQLYPLVLATPGFINTSADQSYPVSSNSVAFDMYVQPEDAAGTSFRGATLTIGFTDGTSITAQIPASSITIPAMGSSMLPVHGSTAATGDALTSWLRGIFSW